MLKRLTAAILSAALLLSLCGCGSLFEKEVVDIQDYEPPVQEKVSEAEKVTVRNFTALKKAITEMVYSGAEGGSLAFDVNYDGDAVKDIEEACWQLRSQNALCAYCVVNISYEISKIVTYYEANISIDYADSALPVSEIIQLPYAIGMEEILKEAMENNRTRLVLFINASTYSRDKMAQLVTDVYRSNPVCSVREPKTDVYLYSGSSRQRLYEINLDYGMTEDELIRCKSQLKNLDVRSNTGAFDMDQAHEALAAYSYLAENCELSGNHGENSAYSALIRGSADSEGVALAYVEMCHQLGIECRIVYGQLHWQDHCWNIVQIDGEYYHVDVSAAISGEVGQGFLRRDEDMWNSYRWDTASYPVCSGALTYWDLA